MTARAWDAEFVGGPLDGTIATFPGEPLPGCTITVTEEPRIIWTDPQVPPARNVHYLITASDRDDGPLWLLTHQP